jgi:glutamine cyclotransferase
LNLKIKNCYQNLKAIVYYEGQNAEATTSRISFDIQPKLLKYTILTYPHDIAAHTQGLEFYRDTLYEGTDRMVNLAYENRL